MTFLRVMAFSLALMLGITWLTNVLPQMESNVPDDEEPIAVGDMDMAGMIAWGESLFSGKGTCTLCHNNLGRAPDLLALDLNATFAERLDDVRYDGVGKGMDGAEGFAAYIRESMLDPSAFVVAGFGKKGSGDTVSPMPVISGPPISLTPTEINAVIAFLQDLAGVDPTVDLPSVEDAVVVDEGGDEAPGPATTAAQAIDKFSCSACHDLNGSGGDIGPSLNSLSKRMSRDEIRTAILNPNATIAPGFDADTMPDDFAEQMFASELELIIDHLMGLEE